MTKQIKLKAKPRIAFVMLPRWKKNLFSEVDLNRLQSLVKMVESKADNLDEVAVKELLKDADGIITSWGTPKLSLETLTAAKGLKVICHGAGSIKHVISQETLKELLKNGMVITTTAPALGIGVAEFTLGLIICGLKKALFMREGMADGKWNEYIGRWNLSGPNELMPVEPYHVTVGVIGAGYCGSHLIKLLNNFEVKILVHDPHKSEEDCRKIGAEKSGLEHLMATSDVITLHAPFTPQTEGMINKDLISKIKDGALFVNTAIAREVDEEALIRELQTGRFYACIDQTLAQPAPKDHPFRNMKNVFLTPHIAGHTSTGFLRQGKYAVDELERFFQNGKVKFGLKADKLAIIE